VRDRLVLDYVPQGVDPVEGHDNIVYDIDNGASPSGWGHPTCPPDSAQVVAEAAQLPVTYPVSTLTP
jgi:hypothetical protein